MIDDLTFEPPFELIGSLLPYNYFPAAFQQFTSEHDEMNRIVLVLPGSEDGRRSAVEYHVVSNRTLRDPIGLGDYLNERGISDGFASSRCFLGPLTTLAETAAGQANLLTFDRLEFAPSEVTAQIAVIIDIGIAFWNPAFRSSSNPRFKAMRYLDFDAFKRGQPALEPLSEAEIASICSDADTPGGQDRVVAALAARFPDSYFGKHGGAEPGTLWHGTAMADLMAGLPRDAPDSIALMGIELPMAVLRDADGDNLGTVLTMLVEAALEMTATVYSALPLVIALPWGFTSGPQDGTHPFAVALDKVLALHPERQVKLLVPMGNQLQDRCCGHLVPSSPAEAENSVIWRLAPDDFSQNSAEFIITKGSPSTSQTVRITAPTGQTALILLKEAQAMLIAYDGVTIGGLLRFNDTPNGPRLRMVLAPTGWRANGTRPCPAGDWTVSFHRNDEARIWILRDDRDWSLDKALPRRTSYLFDAQYRDKDLHGAYLQDDDQKSVVVRAGTASVLATANAVRAVQADETLGSGMPQAASYSGRRTSLKAAWASEIVDRGHQYAGVLAAANGTAQQVRVSGTSAATALAARLLLGLPARPD